MKKSFLNSLILLTAFPVFAQVQLQTGAAQYSYPIFNYADPASGLSTNVVLQYVSGNGIKVNELASNVGLGWALGAGGFIQRIQNGEPDDQDSRELFPPTSNICSNSGSYNASNAFLMAGLPSFVENYIDNYYPNGFLHTEFPVTGGFSSCDLPSELAISPRFQVSSSSSDRRWKRSRRSLADRMQDAFIFNFNEKSGTFFIGRDRSIHVLPDSKIKIDTIVQNMTNQNIRTRISGFTITDENGVKYLFTTMELSEVIKMKVISRWNDGGPGVNPVITKTKDIINGDPSGKYVVQKWLLTEIFNPRTNEKITFQYDDINLDFVAGFDIVLTQNNNNNKYGMNILEQRTRLIQKRLRSIITTGGYKLEFFYDGILRVDEGGQNTSPLTSIRYSNNNKTINTWQFSYRYFFKKDLISLTEGSAKTEDDKKYLRLCLISIQRYGSEAASNLPPTKFDYYTGSGSSDIYEMVPPIRTVSQDHWGYYTLPNTPELITDRHPAWDKLFPIVSQSQLQPNNSTRNPHSAYAKAGLLRNLTYENGGSLTFEYELNRAISGINSKDGILNVTGGLRVSRVIEKEASIASKSNIIEYKYEKPDGSSSGWGHETLVYSVNKVIKTYASSSTSQYNVEGNEISEYSASSPLHPGIGSSMSYAHFSMIMQLASLSRAMIRNSSPISNKTSIGIFILYTVLLVIDISSYDFEAPSTISKFYSYTLNNPLQFQYSRVLQRNISDGISTGYSVTEFTDPGYFNTSIQPITFPFEPKMRYAPWKYGQMAKVSFFDSGIPAIKVREEEYIFNTSVLEQEFVNPNFLSVKLEANIVRSFAYPHSSYFENDISQKSYYPIKGRLELAQKKVRVFANGLSSETVTSYFYDPATFLLKEIITKNSLGEVTGTKIYYPGNYTGITGTALESMRTQNMINVPVTSVTWKQDAGSSVKKVIQASVTEFGQISNGDIKPVNSYSSELSEPTASNITDDASIQTNLINFSFLKLKNNILYDLNGNPVETKAEGNRYSSVIYDYNKRLPVANVTNAKSGEIAYTSFEADGTGNWAFPSTPVTNLQSGITGNFAFNLAGTNTITSNFYLTANSKYKLSFWIKGSKPVFTAQPPYQTTATITDNLVIKKSISGWDFYEGEVSTNIVAKIILTANGTSSNFIDELRLYPASALMVTTTYSPGIGKTSECDANNRIVYYQYDALGRVVAVRNENWDILKAYEYKYKQ